MQIKILGPECQRCVALTENARAALAALGQRAEVVKVTDHDQFVAMGVKSTPALVIDDQIVSFGRVLSAAEIETLIRSATGPIELLQDPTRHLFFTGKGGVGKTSLSTATAIALADAGRRALLSGAPISVNLAAVEEPPMAFDHLDRLVDQLAASGRGLIMVMGKGGVGKTTIAAAVAIGLVRRGHAVHLSTTDPAAHLAMTLEGELPGLKVDRIDPKLETQRYIDKIMAGRSPDLDAQEQALLLEDLQSPCTEEVAVFHAFSRTVAEARSAFVVLDTAPAGHSLLLIDATGAYHRQMTREFSGSGAVHVVTPLMRLQEDLRRAGIEPYAWVVNKSLLASGTHDALLKARLDGERRQMARLTTGLSKRTFVVPWMSEAPVGLQGVERVLEAGSRTQG